MTHPLRFGLWYAFRNPAQWRRPYPELYAAVLDQIEYAEGIGYDDVWLTEHHFDVLILGAGINGAVSAAALAAQPGRHPIFYACCA